MSDQTSEQPFWERAQRRVRGEMTPDEERAFAIEVMGGEERIRLQATIDVRRAEWKRAANEHARRMSASSLDSVEGTLNRLRAAEEALTAYDHEHGTGPIGSMEPV